MKKQNQEALKLVTVFGCALALMSCVTKQITVSRPELNNLDEAMKAHRGEFTECFEHNRAHGTITLQFTLNHLGKMSDPGVFSSTLKNPVADSCILQVLNTVTFPPHTGAELLHIKYPLSSE